MRTRAHVVSNSHLYLCLNCCAFWSTAEDFNVLLFSENTGAKNEPGKKKKFLRRVLSWMRKTLRPCVPSVDGPACDS